MTFALRLAALLAFALLSGVCAVYVLVTLLAAHVAEPIVFAVFVWMLAGAVYACSALMGWATASR